MTSFPSRLFGFPCRLFGGVRAVAPLALVLAPAASEAYAGDSVEQTTYIKASNTSTLDLFGHALAYDGDTLVVGAIREDSAATGVGGNQFDNNGERSGAAYVFVRNGGTWVQQAYLKASNTGAFDYFGTSVAVSGDTIAVGAWEEDSASTGVNGTESDDSAENSGAVYVFVRNGGVWSQQAYLKASNCGAGDRFGAQLDLEGDLLVVGAPEEDCGNAGVGAAQADDSLSNSGAVYVFSRAAGVWSQEEYLKPASPGEEDRFGTSVALSGDTVVVGARFESGGSTGVGGNEQDDSVPSSGAAYVFVRDTTGWSQQAYLKASNAGQYDYFGSAVDVDGDVVVVGTEWEDSGGPGFAPTPNDQGERDSGAAYVFERTGTTWAQSAFLKASNPYENDYFGASVAVRGDHLVVGAYGEDGNAPGVDANQLGSWFKRGWGAAYLFRKEGPGWRQTAYLKSSNMGEDDLGWAVAMGPTTIVVGAPGEDSGAMGIEGDQQDESRPGSGAVYVFSRADSLGSTFCFQGEVSRGTYCPCSNYGGPGRGCANSSGVGARLEASGTDSVLADDLQFTVSGARPHQHGVIVQGAGRTIMRFADGLLCAGSPTERVEVIFLDGGGAGSTGESIVVNGSVSPGQTRYYQAWYRDPGGVSPCGTGSNFTQGLIIDWQ